MGIRTYIVEGLLEAGKTTYILSLLEKEDREKEAKEKGDREKTDREKATREKGDKEDKEKNFFKEKGKTLVAALEEGEVAYPGEGAADSIEGLEVVYPRGGEELKELLEERAREGGLERVFIETNALQGEVELPSCLTVVSRVTLIDASALGVQYRNLLSLFDALVKRSDRIVFNRVSSPELLSAYGDGFRVMNPGASFIQESPSGEVEAFQKSLPFDRDQALISLSEEAYIPWILDLRENPTSYEGKEVELLVQADPRFPAPPGYLLVGRMVMTCCILDVQFLSLPCALEGFDKPQGRRWVRLRGRVERSEAFPEGVAIRALEMEEAPSPENLILMGGAALLPQQ